MHMVAYVVSRTVDQAPDATAFEAALLYHLCAALPAYMPRQHVVLLPALPLTPNGKVDVSGGVAPRTELERSVAAGSGAVSQAAPVDAVPRLPDQHRAPLSLAMSRSSQ